MAVGQHRPAAAPLAAEFLPHHTPASYPLAGSSRGCLTVLPKEALELTLAHAVELGLEPGLEQKMELAVRVSPRGVN